MSNRKTLSKKLRFEIFKRDGFVCRYCGNRPPDVVLEIDHINPVALGGDNDPLNLVSSCVECNRGKKARVLTDVAPRPDADLAYMEIQQEIAEADRYLRAKQARDEAFARVYSALMEVWSDAISEKSWPRESVVKSWLSRYPAEDVEGAIIATGSKWRSGSLRNFSDILRYVWGVLKNQEENREGSDPRYAALMAVAKQLSVLDVDESALLDFAGAIEDNPVETEMLLQKAWFGIAATAEFDHLRLAATRRRINTCSGCSRGFEQVATIHIKDHVLPLGCDVCQDILGDILANQTEALHPKDRESGVIDVTRLFCVECSRHLSREDVR